MYIHILSSFLIAMFKNIRVLYIRILIIIRNFVTDDNSKMKIQRRFRSREVYKMDEKITLRQMLLENELV